MFSQTPESPEVLVMHPEHEEELGDRDELEPEEEDEELEDESNIEIIDVNLDLGTNNDYNDLDCNYARDH